MNSYLIALGSNMGDRAHYISSAKRLLSALPCEIVAEASNYETNPIGAADQKFINTALICKSQLAPAELLSHLLQIELHLGRERLVHWGNRTIDLDIILALDAQGKLISINTEALTIPHPRAKERDFVLKPCTEIAPEWIQHL